MAKWQFRRSRKILPGVRMNISGKGIGFSVGGPGGRISLSPNKKRITLTQSIPGTGLRKSEVYSVDKLKQSMKQGQSAEGGSNLRYRDYKSLEFQQIYDSLRTKKYTFIKRLFLTNFISMLLIAFLVNDEKSPLGYVAAFNFFIILASMPIYFVMRNRRLKAAREKYENSQIQNIEANQDEQK